MKEEKIKKFSIGINASKVELLKNDFTYGQFVDVLVKHNVAYPKFLFSKLKHGGYIHKVANNGKQRLYQFVDADPIYFKKIEILYQEISDYFDSKSSVEEPIFEEHAPVIIDSQAIIGKLSNMGFYVCSSDTRLEESIALLKSLGYKVLKPKIDYEEI